MTLFTQGGSTFRITCGIPQGITLSPLVFVIYLSDKNKCLPYGFKSPQYVNNVSIYTAHKSITKTVEKSQEALINIEKLFEYVHINLSVVICKTLVITKKRKVSNNNDITLMIEGYQLPLENSVRILGVTLDCKLNVQQPYI